MSNIDDTKLSLNSTFEAFAGFIIDSFMKSGDISVPDNMDDKGIKGLEEATKRLLKYNEINCVGLIIMELYKLKYESEKLRERGGVLSDKDIIKSLGKDVIISPFREEQLCPSTYDVCLGKYFYRTNSNKKLKYLNPENGKHIMEYWNVIPDEKKNYGALEAQKISTQEDADLYGVNIGDEIITLEPGELILGHTIEFIGGRENITTMIKTRSTMGRCGISTAKCAGQGDPGYFNRWTLEIENHTTSTVVLRVGVRVGHIMFLRTGPVEKQYNIKGNYQTSDNVEELEKSWIPLNMIPSAGAKLAKQIVQSQ